jgi:nucleotide-binding universal stress UspA family protein
MYKTVVIPLDMSEEAEKTLLYVRYLAAPKQSRLILVNSIEPKEYVYTAFPELPSIQAGLLGSIDERVQGYLATLQNQLQGEGYAVTTRVAQGDAAQFIVDVALEEEADLIAMTTHGRTGFTRWALGSVADRVIRTAYQPVFLIRSTMPIPEDLCIQKILVPLDGSFTAESALAQAESIARDTGAVLTLLRVVEPLTRLERQLLSEAKQSPDQIDVERTEAAHTYLHTVVQRLRTEGITAAEYLYTGSAAQAILQVAEEEGSDLIVMSTHGYSGYTRWVYGSVANTVLHSATCPMLLNRAFPKKIREIQEEASAQRMWHPVDSLVYTPA